MARYGDTVPFDNRQKGQAMEALEQHALLGEGGQAGHVAQRNGLAAPRAAQVGHGVTLITCPKNDFCARRTSPAPAHVVHRLADVPGSAPLP